MLEAEQLGPFCQRYGISLVVLFGSQAKGQANAESDVDIGLWLDRYPISPEEELALIRELVHITRNADLDVVILNHANPVLGYDVAIYGQPLYERELHTFVHYQIRAWRRFVETAKLRRLQSRYIKAFSERRSASC